MFNPTAQEAIREIEAAEKHRDDHMRGVSRLIREYTGRWYRGGDDLVSSITATGDEAGTNPEPFSYSFVSNIMPSLIFDNPAVSIKVRRIIGHQQVKEALEMAYEGWFDDVPFQEESSDAVRDMLFFTGVTMHYLEDDTRWSDGAVRPTVKRIPFADFFMDPTAESVRTTAYLGHKYRVDLEDLMADPDLKEEVLASLAPAADQSPDRPNNQPFHKPSDTELGRKRITVYMLWQRDSNLLRFFIKAPQAMEIYEPREWYGDKSIGPYCVYGAYSVPGQVWPLAPLVAVLDQIRDMNSHAFATARSAAGRKTVVITDGTNPDLAENVKHAEDREVIAITGFSSSQLQQIELGGVSNAQYGYLEYLRARLDRHSGLTENARGQGGGSDTATEAQIANESFGNRVAFLKQQVRKCVAQSLQAVGWYFFHTPGIIIPVSRTDPMTGQMTEGLFFGGPVSGENMGSWHDYQVKIEPFSMQRVSEGLRARQAMEFANFILTVAPQMPQMPWVRWMEIIRLVGQSMNHTNVDVFFQPALMPMLGMFPQQDLLAPSMAMAADDSPADRFSRPGMGMKSSIPSGIGSNANAGVDAVRQQAGQQFGGQYGGMRQDPAPFGGGR